MTTVKTKNPQLGLTLIELMIALVLGLLLVAGVIQVFVNNNHTARVTEAHSRLQENARFALEILTRDVRSAGYAGCRKIADEPRNLSGMKILTTATNPVPTVISPETFLTGYNAEGANWSPSLPTDIATEAITGTDVISVQRGIPCGGNLVKNVTASDEDIEVVVPNRCQIKGGGVVMISDCEYAHVFKATDVVNTTSKQTISHGLKFDSEDANTTEHFCKSYPSPIDPTTFTACEPGETKLYNYDSEILKFSSLTYYIRLGENGDRALWVYDGSTSSELVEGIENIQVLYGIDDESRDNIVDRYETAKTINDANEWYKVVSARISILTQTLETSLTTGNQKVTYNGAVLSGDDGRIRRVFTSTIAIRNRVQ